MHRPEIEKKNGKLKSGNKQRGINKDTHKGNATERLTRHPQIYEQVGRGPDTHHTKR